MNLQNPPVFSYRNTSTVNMIDQHCSSIKIKVYTLSIIVSSSIQVSLRLGVGYEQGQMESIMIIVCVKKRPQKIKK